MHRRALRRVHPGTHCIGLRRMVALGRRPQLDHNAGNPRGGDVPCRRRSAGHGQLRGSDSVRSAGRRRALGGLVGPASRPRRGRGASSPTPTGARAAPRARRAGAGARADEPASPCTNACTRPCGNASARTAVDQLVGIGRVAVQPGDVQAARGRRAAARSAASATSSTASTGAPAGTRSHAAPIAGSALSSPTSRCQSAVGVRRVGAAGAEQPQHVAGAGRRRPRPGDARRRRGARSRWSARRRPGRRP